MNFTNVDTCLHQASQPDERSKPASRAILRGMAFGNCAATPDQMKITFTLFALCCAFSGGTIAAGSTQERSYALPERGKLVMAVPQDWGDKVRQPPNQLPPSLRFSGKPDGKFQVLVTPLWSPRGDPEFKSAASVRRMVERAAADASKQAVERNLPVVELKGGAGAGFYFFATDRAPAPGEYKYLTQGAMAVGDLVVTFTVLSNDAESAEAKAALEMLRGARHANPL